MRISYPSFKFVGPIPPASWSYDACRLRPCQRGGLSRS
jgi:hypothetical protein